MKFRNLAAYLDKQEDACEYTSWTPDHRWIILIYDPDAQDYLRATYFQLIIEGEESNDDSVFVIQTEGRPDDPVNIKVGQDETDTDFDIQLYKRMHA